MTDNGTGRFVGAYVNDLRDCIIAASLSGLNALIAGPPGKGKTEIARSAARAMFGDKPNWLQIDCTPTMGKQKIEGFVDPQKVFNESKWEYVLDNCARNPDAHLVILDEMTRANDPILEMLIGLMADKDTPYQERKIFVGTANFVQNTSRLDAVFDRVGFVIWTPRARNDIRALSQQWAKANDAPLEVEGEFPTWERIQDVRRMKLTDKSSLVVEDFLANLSDEIDEGLKNQDGDVVRMFDLEERRQRFWHTILSRLSMHYHDSEDFDSVHPMAKQALRWAWMSKSDEEYRDWGDMVAAAAGDPTDLLFRTLLKTAYQKLKTSAEANLNDRMNASVEMMKFVNESFMPEAKKLGIDTDDPRLKEAQKTLQLHVFTFVRGDKEFAIPDDIDAVTAGQEESDEQNDMPF